MKQIASWISRLVIVVYALPFVILLGYCANDEISGSTYFHPEKYTSLVPAYLQVTNPKIINDSGNFMGGGVFAVQMDLNAEVAKKIKDNPKFLVGLWNETPVSKERMSASHEAEFLMYVGDKQLNEDIQRPGNYWMSIRWPATGRLGILVTPAAKRVYYIESGN